MQNAVRDYHKNFIRLIDSIQVRNDKKQEIEFYRAIESVVTLIKKQASAKGKMFFIGNGGSACIASHMAVDFWKNGKIPAFAFNDIALLTCVSNDFGYEHVFAKPIEFIARNSDMLFAISSSGKSKNILKAVEATSALNAGVITLSGFDKNNPLRSKGKYNFYVHSHEYGFVEVIHQYICHFILDVITAEKVKGKKENPGI